MRRRDGSATGRAAIGRPVIGWREWVGLPALLDRPIKAKIDSGARTSAIHSFRTRRFVERGAPWVAFALHPVQAEDEPEIDCLAAIVDERMVRSSNGDAELRPFIATEAVIGAHRWPIELSLAERDMMGFRMLLGRAAVRGRFLIDAGRSFRLSDRDAA